MKGWLFFSLLFWACVCPRSQGQMNTHIFPIDTSDWECYSDTTKARMLLDSAAIFQNKGNLLSALKCARATLNLQIGSLGLEDTITAKTLNDVGWIYYEMNNPDSCIQYSLLAEKMSLKTLNRENLIQAVAYNNYAAAKEVQGKFQEALTSYFKSLQIREKLLPQGNSQIAASYHNIGSLYNKLGEYQNAQHMLDKALNTFKRAYGNIHEDIASTYNSMGVLYDEMGDYKKAIDNYQKALEIRMLQSEGKETPKIALTYSNIGTALANSGDYINSLKTHEKALQIRNEILSKNDPDLAYSYNNIAAALTRLGDYQRAIIFFKKALQIRIANYGPTNSSVAVPYFNLGATWDNKGDYHRAIEYYTLALNIWREDLGENHPYIALVHSNIGVSYINLKNYELAAEHLKIAYDSYISIYGNNNLKILPTLNSLAMVYREKGDLDQCIALHFSSLDILKSHYKECTSEFGHTLSYIGVALRALHKYKESKKYFFEAMRCRLKSLPDQHPLIAKTKLLLAETFLLCDQLDSAKHYRDLSYVSLDINRDSLEKISYISDIGLYKNLLTLEINILTKEGLKSGENRLHELQWIAKINSEFEDYILREVPTQSTITYYKGQCFSNIDQLLTSFSRLSLLPLCKSCFSNVDNFKSKLLLYAFKSEATTRLSSNNPLIEAESNITLEIDQVRKKIFMLQREKALDSNFTKLNNDLFSLQLTRDSIRNKIKDQFPRYWNLKYNFDMASISDIQNNLSQHQTLLEYFVGDSSIYAFVVKKDTFHIEEIRHDFPLSIWIKDLQNAILTPDRQSLPSDSLHTVLLHRAQDLFQRIIAPVEDWLTDQLIIVPDGVLGYLPFDLLIKNETDHLSEAHYMILDHQIAYQYSATLWLEMMKKEVLPTREVLACVPDFPTAPLDWKSMDTLTQTLATRDRLWKLTYAPEEVQSISNIWQVHTVSDTQATVQNFIQDASDYRILHLSTHGKADDRVGDYCYLAFTQTSDTLDHKLYVRDLYNMKLNADMVVLSACETGLGELQQGEGILSLARGFAYAGAKSIVSTLWSVNDQSTRDIMASFYKYLKKGKTKDAALRQAKLDYLGEHPGASPYYWAAFTAVGDMSPITREENPWLWLSGLVVLILFAAIIFWWKGKAKVPSTTHNN